MPTNNEIVAAAMAMLKEDPIFIGMLNGGELHQLAEAALRAAEAERIAKRRRDCTHPHKSGTGTIASDGSGSYQWSCPDCGAEGHSNIPPLQTRGSIISCMYHRTP